MGGDPFFNLYVSLGGVSPFFPLANSGNGAGTSISIPLVPGLNTFGIRGEPGSVQPFFSLNLFFDGNNATPRAGAVLKVESPKGQHGSDSTPQRRLAHALAYTLRLAVALA